MYGCVLVDVFTDVPLEGNQLAVFPDAENVPEALLQPLAREIGFSETVYVLRPATPGATVRVRIFTPAKEIPFAGHPVLGTAFVMAARLGVDDVVLETGSGLVPVAIASANDGRRRGRMTQPVPTVDALDDATARAILDAVGAGESKLPMEVYDNGIRHTYLALPDEASVGALRPDMAAFASIAGDMGVNCFAGGGTRWKTRMFDPGAGVPEDAATGSAAGPLAVHLARHGLVSWGDELEIRQGVELFRPSVLYARADGGAGGPTRVEVAGGAVVVGSATFEL
ncbi:MAG: PhzF family phenazine biosynthesis protein [Chloroflexi bacterium]|nr:PhzF family phenazine biosynthesis protein [Chloroflexota bacterium]